VTARQEETTPSKINWDEPVAIVLRRGDAAAVVQAIGYGNNVPEEAKRGAKLIQASMSWGGSDPRKQDDS